MDFSDPSERKHVFKGGSYGLKDIVILDREDKRFDEKKFTTVPIILVGKSPKKQTSDKPFNTPDLFKKEFDLEEKDVLGVNGEFLRAVFLNPELNIDFITKHLFSSNDGELQKGDKILPSQAIFLIIFHYIYFLGTVEPMLPLYTKTFAEKYKAIVDKVMPDSNDDPVISTDAEKLNKYISDLQKDFKSTRFSDWKSLHEAIQGEPKKILDNFKESTESELARLGDGTNGEEEESEEEEEEEEEGEESEEEEEGEESEEEEKEQEEEEEEEEEGKKKFTYNIDENRFKEENDKEKKNANLEVSNNNENRSGNFVPDEIKKGDFVKYAVEKSYTRGKIGEVLDVKEDYSKGGDKEYEIRWNGDADDLVSWVTSPQLAKVTESEAKNIISKKPMKPSKIPEHVLAVEKANAEAEAEAEAEAKKKKDEKSTTTGLIGPNSPENAFAEENKKLVSPLPKKNDEKSATTGLIGPNSPENAFAEENKKLVSPPKISRLQRKIGERKLNIGPVEPEMSDEDHIKQLEELLEATKTSEGDELEEGHFVILVSDEKTNPRRIGVIKRHIDNDQFEIKWPDSEKLDVQSAKDLLKKTSKNVVEISDAAKKLEELKEKAKKSDEIIAGIKATQEKFKKNTKEREDAFKASRALRKQKQKQLVVPNPLRKSSNDPSSRRTSPENARVSPVNEVANHIILDDFDSLEKINSYIGGKYTLDGETKNTGKTLEQFNLTGYNIMFSSGQSNDCLIHTFLTATCENFRNLEQNNKDEFANIFRRQVYPLIIDALNEKTKVANTGRALSKSFLDDTDITYLVKYYKTNAIVFEDEKTKPDPEKKQKTVEMKRCIVLHLYNDATPDAYMIYNSSGHFESVRRNRSYSLPLKEAQDLAAANKCQFHADEKSACLFLPGDKVIYKRKAHWIIWRRVKEGSTACDKYGLTDNEDQSTDFLIKAPLDQKEIDSYVTVIANADEVSAPKKKGGYLKSKKSRKFKNKTRKLARV